MARQLYISETLTDAGAVLSPASNATISSIFNPPAGVYEVRVGTTQEGTVDTTRLADLVLKKGGTSIGKVPSNFEPMYCEFPQVVLDGASSLAIVAANGPAAGAIYVATIQATRVA